MHLKQGEQVDLHSKLIHLEKEMKTKNIEIKDLTDKVKEAIYIFSNKFLLYFCF